VCGCRAADRVACTCGEGAKIVTMESGEVLAVIMGDSAAVTSMAWHPSGEQIAVSTRSLQTRFWAMPDLSEEGRAAAPAPDDDADPESGFAAGPRCEELHTFKAHDMPVASMCFDTTGALLATGDSMGNVRVWDAVRKYCTHNFHAHRGAVYAVGFHPDKSRYQLFSAGQDSRVQVYDLRKKAHVHTFDSHQGAVSSLCFSPCGTFLASGGRDQVVNVWKVSPELGGQVSEILALERIEGVAFVAKPAGGAEPKKKKKQGKDQQAAAQLCVVTAGERGLLRSWDAASGKEILTAGEDSDDAAVVAAPGEPPAAELIALHSFPQRPGSDDGSTAPGLLAVTVEQNLVVRSSLAPTFPLETVLVGTLDEINDARYCRASNADAASVT
jgi:U3 small nucleolar RNA-associated protein 13